MNAAVRIRRRVASPLAALLLVGSGVSAAAVAFSASPAAAATIHVSTEAAFDAAWNSTANDTIVLDADIHLTCVGGGRAVRDAGKDAPITVDGQGKFTLIQDCSSNGVLGVESNSNVTLRGVTLTGAVDAGEGGGIRFRGSGSSQWTMDHVTFANNATGGTNDGGAIQIRNHGGTLTVTDSTFRNNHAADDGGAINCNQDAGSVTINVARSTFTGNSTTLNNESQGGAIDLESANCSLTMVNSTVTGNTSADLAAISAEQETDHVTLVYSDIVNNTFTPGGSSGLAAPAPNGQASKDSSGPPEPPDPVQAARLANSPANVFVENPANLTVFGSVITSPHGGPNCAGAGGTAMTGITSLGYNFADDTSCGLGASTDKQGAGNNPALGALADNGGPTQTLLPQTGSPLIDAIPPAACQTAPVATGITTDQRGVTRPQGPGCEIGSVEIQVATPIVITPKFTG